MQHYEHVINVYMHEIALHVDHNIDDFKPPFLGDLGPDKHPDIGTATHLEALSACLTSIHKACEIFASLDRHILQCVPTLHFIRSAYVLTVLIRLHCAAAVPGSKLGQVFRPADFKIEVILDKILGQLKLAVEADSGRTVARFLVIMTMMKTWYLKRTEGSQATLPMPHFLEVSHGKCANQDESAALPSEQQVCRILNRMFYRRHFH
jgi:hypothetical protein